MTKSATAATVATVAASTAAAEKLARHRLSVLELAQTLGSVSAACRQRGVSRTQFYEYKKRFQEQGAGADWPQRPAADPQDASADGATGGGGAGAGAEPGAARLGLL